MSSDIYPTEAAVLREAKEILYRNGWFQGGMRGPDDSLCLVGAIREACRTALANGESLSRKGTLWTQLAAQIGTGRIGYWNDQPERTFDEVVDVLDKTAWNLQEGLVD